MIVYSDVAAYTYVGNITAPIHRIVSYKQSKSRTQSHQEFVNVHYVPLANSYIDQILLISKMKLPYLFLSLVEKL